MEPWWKRALTSWQMGLLSLLGFLAMLWGLDWETPWDTWLAMLFGEWNRQMFFLILFLLSFALLCIHIGFVLARDGEPYRGLWARLKSAPQTPIQVPCIDDIMHAFGVSSMNQMTHQQAEDANAQWAGKRIQISGKIYTILSTVPPSISGTTAENLMCVQLSSKEVSGFDVLFQSNLWRDTLARMNRGDHLTMSATIGAIYANGNMWLTDGVVVGPSRPRSWWSGRGGG